MEMKEILKIHLYKNLRPIFRDHQINFAILTVILGGV